MGFPGANNVRWRPQGLERRGMSAHPEPAIGRIAGSTERRDRTTTVAVLAAAQNGTSGVSAYAVEFGSRTGMSRGPSSTAIPSVRRFLSNQLPHVS